MKLAEEQMAALQAAQAESSQQQMLDALQAMQVNSQSAMSASQNAALMSQYGAMGYGGGGGGSGNGSGGGDGDDANKDSKSGMAKQLRESLLSSIVTESPNVRWEDVAGLAPAKDELQEAVVFPLRFPHMFQGKRKPRRAILLYGPPGTSKSYLAKAVATEVEYTLFSISATDLTSKWFGESESLVRQLYELAREKKPSVIFIDEIDALCNNRESGGGGGGSGDDATTARLKTEFLVQLDGVGHGNNDGVVLLAATNLPWSLDPAIRRRFQKRIHIPLPDTEARVELFRIHGGEEWTGVVGEAGGAREVAVGAELARRTEGFSGSDVAKAMSPTPSRMR
jgi:vacuolar protein-sorting-associated protein 4